jgi:uncharacterized membrane protein
MAETAMPFCTQCGGQVSDADQYCAACGTSQKNAQSAPKASDPLSKVKSSTVATLCYLPVAGSLACLYALAAQRFRSDRNTRFHAFQGLYLFVGWLILDWWLGPMFGFGGAWSLRTLTGMMRLLLLGVGIYMMIKTSQNEVVRLPIVGELAERSLAEQR